MRVALVELPYFAERAPLEIAVSGVPQIKVRNLPEASRRIKPRGYLMGQRLVLYKAVLVGGSNSLFVQPHRIQAPAFEAGDLDRHQGVFVAKRRWIA